MRISASRSTSCAARRSTSRCRRRQRSSSRGRISMTETASEGPMGEFAGFTYPGDSTMQPIYHVSAFTHRRDPILPVAVAGHPVEENHTAWGIPNCAEVVYQLRQGGVPVTSAYMPLESGCQFLVITVPSDWREAFGRAEPRRADGQDRRGLVGAQRPHRLRDRQGDGDRGRHRPLEYARCRVGLRGQEHALGRSQVLRGPEHGPSSGVPAGCRSPALQDDQGDLQRADAGGRRPGVEALRSTFGEDWPRDVQERVLARWSTDYGYPAGP